MGIGSITFSLPHFLSGNYMVQGDLNVSSDNICSRVSPPAAVAGAAGAAPSATSPNPADFIQDDLLEKLGDKIKSIAKGTCNNSSD